MRVILIGLFITVCLNSNAQKFALIDRDYKKPILFTDSVTISQVSSNYFPVRVNDLDSLIANLEYLKTQLNSVQRSKFKSYKLRSGSSIILVTAVKHAYGDAYDILLTTATGYLNAEYLLADNTILNKKSIRNINRFIDFVKKDKELIIKELKEYEPTILDPTIYIQ